MSTAQYLCSNLRRIAAVRAAALETPPRWFNGIAALERTPAGSLHAVFIDPPFADAALYLPALAAAARALRPEGVVYLEAPRSWEAEELAAVGLAPLRTLRAGAVHAHLLKLDRP